MGERKALSAGSRSAAWHLLHDFLPALQRRRKIHEKCVTTGQQHLKYPKFHFKNVPKNPHYLYFSEPHILDFFVTIGYIGSAKNNFQHIVWNIQPFALF